MDQCLLAVAVPVSGAPRIDLDTRDLRRVVAARGTHADVGHPTTLCQIGSADARAMATKAETPPPDDVLGVEDLGPTALLGP